MKAHEHKAAMSRTLFGAMTLSTCACGARKRSDGQKVLGSIIDAQGWCVPEPRKPRNLAYERLQNEGYDDGPEPRDYATPFDVPGAE